jgi:uncharacterized protein YbaP (TraB family)
MKSFKQIGWALLLVPSLFAFKGQHKPVIEKALLWEISGNDLTQPSYVFGTIHMIGKKDYFFSPTAKEKFKSCTVLATEIDMNMSMQQKIDVAMKTLLPNNRTVNQYMDSTDFRRLEDYMLTEAGIKEKKIEKYLRLKPFFLSSIILSEELGDVKSYEEEFVKMAKKNQIESMGLESIEYQFGVLESISIPDQVTLLMEGIGDTTGINQFDEMVALYKDQDLAGLYMYTVSESDDIPDFKAKFIDQRNANWIPVIEKAIHQKPTFIAVGAGHLPGEYGVLALLKKQGYTVTPVTD